MEELSLRQRQLFWITFLIFLLWSITFPIRKILPTPLMINPNTIVLIMVTIFFIIFTLSKCSNGLMIEGKSHILLYLFLIWAITSLPLSVNFTTSLIAIPDYMKLLVISVLVYNIAFVNERATHLFIYSLLSGISTLSIGVLWSFLKADPTYTGRFLGRYSAFNSTINKLIGVNRLGAYLAIGAALFWYLTYVYYDKDRSYIMYINLSSTFFLIATVLLTGSRQSILAIIPIVLSQGYFIVDKLDISTKHINRSCVIFSVFISLIALTLMGLLTNYLSIPSSAPSRFHIYRGTFHLIQSQSIGDVVVGTGINTFNIAIENSIGARRGAHNTLLKVLVELGIVGFSIIVLLFISIFRIVITDENRLVLASIYLSILPLVLFNDWLTDPLIIIVLTLIIGVAQNGTARLIRIV